MYCALGRSVIPAKALIQSVGGFPGAAASPGIDSEWSSRPATTNEESGCAQAGVVEVVVEVEVSVVVGAFVVVFGA